MPLARSLTRDERERLLRLMQVFLHDKPFEGCAGLEVTEEMKVTIAGHACLLLLNLDGPCYPGVQCILVYPEAFLAKRLLPNTRITLEPLPGPHPLAGESWHGVVVVSWDDMRRSVADPHDGQNVALHEFAHELDKEDGWADGVPPLGSRSAVRTWGRVLAEHYDRLRQQADRGEPSALDAYGATNKAEFFAVATETFFENPHKLRATAPDLYEMLRAYYRQDPATRAQESAWARLWIVNGRALEPAMERGYGTGFGIAWDSAFGIPDGFLGASIAARVSVAGNLFWNLFRNHFSQSFSQTFHQVSTGL